MNFTRISARRHAQYTYFVMSCVWQFVKLDTFFASPKNPQMKLDYTILFILRCSVMPCSRDFHQPRDICLSILFMQTIRFVGPSFILLIHLQFIKFLIIVLSPLNLLGGKFSSISNTFLFLRILGVLQFVLY